MNKRLMLTLTMIMLLGIVLAIPRSAGATMYQVSIVDFTFLPHGLHIAVGDTVEWTNHDGVPHSSTSDTGIWDSGLLSMNDTYMYTFSGAGTFPYHCSVHTSMRDTIVVSEQTSIGDQSVSIPDQLKLAQNYPNPFNARTEISYSLAQASHVKVTIYNLLGQQVVTLVDQNQAAGEHRVNWDAANQPTGVYFYRLQAGDFSQSRRMVLLK